MIHFDLVDYSHSHVSLGHEVVCYQVVLDVKHGFDLGAVGIVVNLLVREVSWLPAVDSVHALAILSIRVFGLRKLPFLYKVNIISILLRNLIHNTRISPLENMVSPGSLLYYGDFIPLAEYFLFSLDDALLPGLVVSDGVVAVKSRVAVM